MRIEISLRAANIFYYRRNRCNKCFEINDGIQYNFNHTYWISPRFFRRHPHLREHFKDVMRKYA